MSAGFLVLKSPEAGQSVTRGALVETHLLMRVCNASNFTPSPHRKMCWATVGGLRLSECE